MKDPAWVPLRAVVAIQRALIAEHGGLAGSPRESDLEVALAQPVNLFTYAETPPSLPRLAAACGFALARGHCFPDGNKRAALTVIDVFLRLNDFELTADELDAVHTIQLLAAGELTEQQLAEWIGENQRQI